MKPLLHSFDHGFDVFDVEVELARHVMTGGISLHDLRERLVVRREMFQHQQEGNHSVIGVEIFAKVIMPAQLPRK